MLSDLFLPVSHKKCTNRIASQCDYVYHLFSIIDKARLMPSTRKEAEAHANAPQARGLLQAMHIRHMYFVFIKFVSIFFNVLYEYHQSSFISYTSYTVCVLFIRFNNTIKIKNVLYNISKIKFTLLMSAVYVFYTLQHSYKSKSSELAS